MCLVVQSEERSAVSRDLCKLKVFVEVRPKSIILKFQTIFELMFIFIIPAPRYMNDDLANIPQMLSPRIPHTKLA